MLELVNSSIPTLVTWPSAQTFLLVTYFMFLYAGNLKELVFKMGRTIQLYGFPCYVTEDTVKSFVEGITGEGTIDTFKIMQGKGTVPRVFAIIQFVDAKDASYILSKPEKSIWYRNSYLKARELENDIVPKPKTFLHCLEGVKLYFGCQISKEKFYVLWNEVNTKVKFGIGMRKIQFLLSYRGMDYKFELSYENVWQIEMHRPQGEAAVYLLIQVIKYYFFLWRCKS